MISRAWLFLLPLFLVLVACEAPQTKPSSRPVKTSMPVSLEPEMGQLERTLAAAERALASNRLTIPRGDNALSYYQAALALDPNSSQAKSGLQMIPLRYVEMSRGAAAKGQVSKARTWLQRALTIDPGNRPAKELLAKINAVPAVVKTDPEQNANNDNVYVIDPKALRSRDKSLHPYLQLIAQRARIEDLLAIITAPTDADGRWVYLQMKKALPGYRLRGDIRRGKRAQVELEAP